LFLSNLTNIFLSNKIHCYLFFLMFRSTLVPYLSLLLFFTFRRTMSYSVLLCSVYSPPADMCAEFEVERTSVPAGVLGYRPIRLKCSCILLVLEGSATLTLNLAGEQQPLKVSPGSIVFTASDADVSISVEGAENLLLYRAHVNLGGF